MLWNTRFSSWKSTFHPSGTKMSTPVASMVVPLPPEVPSSPPSVGVGSSVRSVASSVGEEENPPEVGETLPTVLGLSVVSEPGMARERARECAGALPCGAELPTRARTR